MQHVVQPPKHSSLTVNAAFNEVNAEQVESSVIKSIQSNYT
jgi:hypothetical protein